jgi:protein TonB
MPPKKKLMFKNRLFISYVATALLYLLVVGIFFYLQQSVFVAKEQVKEQVLCMSLHTFVPEVMPVEEAEPQKPVSEPEPIQEPETQEDLVLKEEPEVQKEVVPEPTVVTPKPKPIVKQTKKKPVAKKKPNKPTTQKKVATPKPIKQQAASRQSKSSAAEQNQFLAAIREKINQHKSYPRIAKKRGMQGAINVKFMILSSGKVAQITVSGPKIFHASAEHAVQSAFPIDVKKAPLSLPTTVSITLQYKFR